MARSLPPERDKGATRPDGSDSLRAAIDRRVLVTAAGHAGHEAIVREYLDDQAPAVRAAAVAALVRLGRLEPGDARRALRDGDASVRRQACEHGGVLPARDVRPLLDDPDPGVVEAAAFALGELGDRHATARLAALARSHPDPLCRESAVAALGAIGAQGGVEALFDALGDAPAIRRRAVVALAAFSGPAVEDAVRAHLTDRDWQVRQAAEDVLEIIGATG